MLKTTWHRLINIGVTESLSQERQKRIRLTNGIALCIGSTALPFLLPHFLLGNWEWLERNFYFMGFFGFILLLNRFHRYFASRWILMIGTTGFILISSHTQGREHMTHMFFLGLIGVPFMLFEMRERISIILGALWFMAAFMLVENKNIHYFDGVVNAEKVPGGSLVQAFFIFGLITSIIWYFRSENEKSEKKLNNALHELQEHQARMVQSSKLSALGEMAGGIAHEINNPLSVIQLRTKYMETLLQGGKLSLEDIRPHLASIQETVRRISRIIAGLRAFAREGANDPLEWASVYQIIQDVLELSLERFKVNGIQVHVPPQAETKGLELLCRSVEVAQILVNLLNNSFDAVRDQEVKWISIGARLENDRAIIEVTDSGTGIAPSLRHRIFDPFFTTKPIGVGTGLGLSISKGLAERQHGRLVLDANHPHTLFRLELPGRLANTVASDGVTPG